MNCLAFWNLCDGTGRELWDQCSMYLQLCNLEQTRLKVFRYGQLILDKTLVTREGIRGQVEFRWPPPPPTRLVVDVAGGLERVGFELIAVAGVVDVLSHVAEEIIDPLLSRDMPHAGNGFTVVSAMRDTHPQASDAGAQWLPAPEEPELFLCDREPRCQV